MVASLGERAKVSERRRPKKTEVLIRRPPRGNGEINFSLSLSLYRD